MVQVPWIGRRVVISFTGDFWSTDTGYSLGIFWLEFYAMFCFLFVCFCFRGCFCFTFWGIQIAMGDVNGFYTHVGMAGVFRVIFLEFAGIELVFPKIYTILSTRLQLFIFIEYF